MSANTPYGKCKGGCEKWVPRDEMLSVNVAAYDASNKPQRIRIRVCPKCQPKLLAYLAQFEWDGVLKKESEIRADPELVIHSDLEFDDSEAAMRKAGRLEG